MMIYNQAVTQWSCLFIGIYSSHEEHMFHFVVVVGNVNLGDVVEVLGPLFNRVPIETLGNLRRSSIGAVKRCFCRFSVLRFFASTAF